MRTTITIPDDLLQDLYHYSHVKKTTEAVIIAINEWVQYKKIQGIKNLRGKLAIEGDLNELRSREVKKIRKLDEKK